MLYLAQVNRNPTSEGGSLPGGSLQLLARQQDDGGWCVGDREIVSLKQDHSHPAGVLVFIELGRDGEILTIREATDWILELIEKFLSPEVITPEFVQREELRIEQWRQEITVQSLELTRRNLEIETRRDQLQELEDSLKQERERLDLRAAQLQQRQKELDRFDSQDNHR
jgi:hypothetical protein